MEKAEVSHERNPVMGMYPAKDGRWSYIHANFPNHRAAALQVLGVPEEKEAVRQAVAKRDALELEEASSPPRAPAAGAHDGGMGQASQAQALAVPSGIFRRRAILTISNSVGPPMPEPGELGPFRHRAHHAPAPLAAMIASPIRAHPVWRPPGAPPPFPRHAEHLQAAARWFGKLA